MATSAGRQWTKKETELFIRRLEAFPELWDVSSDIYKDRNRRAVSSVALANEFFTDTKEIGRKLHNLRTQLNSELRKMKKKKSGSGTDVYKSGWQFFDALQFMVPSSRIEEQTTSNLVSENPAEDGDSQHSDPLPPPPPAKKKNLALKDAILDSALQIRQVKDDDQIFGDFVASALRNLSSPQLKKSLRLKIQRAVLEVEEIDSEM